MKATLISWPGKLRAGLDYFKKPYQLDKNGDVSIGHFFKYHLGQEMMDKLIEPLLAGIYGGDIYKISLLSTFPHFIQVEQKYGNMVKGMMAAKMGHSKAGVTKAAKGAVAEGDVPRAGKGTMTDRQFESHEAKSTKAQADMASRKGTAAQSGMFRQLTGGLESVITAIVEAMPSNVTLYTSTLVSDIRYTDGQYVLDIVKQDFEDCNCNGQLISHECSDVESSLVKETTGNSVTAHTDQVIICTPPATYNQWFKDDEGFDFLRSMEQSSCAIAIMAFDKATFNGDLKGSGLLITS